MASIDPTSGAPAPLTADQEAALKRLHVAATQLEGVFVNMLFKQMRENAPKETLTGKVSESERTFKEMLDRERADKLAQSGSIGIAKIIERQLRDQVLNTLTPGAPPAGAPPAGAVPPAAPRVPDETKS